ncbi:MAG: hypothetical protein WAU75_06330 [Solirubrobacteraceae bacterium]
MRIDRIAVGDIVKASIKGRVVYGEVLQIVDGVVHFRPLSPAAGWRHATAHEITAHWRKARRRSTSENEDDASPQPAREQLSIPGVHT